MAGGVPVATTILRKRRVTGASLSPALAPFSEHLASSQTRPVGDSSWLRGGRSPIPITLHPWSPEVYSYVPRSLISEGLGTDWPC